MSGLKSHRHWKNAGVNVLTAQTDGTTRMPDPELLDRATSLSRILVTHDKDLLIEGTARQAAHKFFAGIIFAHPLHITLRRCIDDLELAAKICKPEEMANRILFLPIS